MICPPRFVRVFSALALALSAIPIAAQNPPQQQIPPPPANTASIDAYIHQAWSTLTRSMSDCASLVDPKLKTEPVLYLPVDLPMPPEVQQMQQHCRVDVERLPVKITHFGQIKLTDIKTPGLLYLPNPYIVPGGRFNEMYGWDSFFILRGLLDDGRLDLARGMVENFFFEIEHYGGILNANRTYYFTRSQPPFLSSMIRAIYDAEVAAGQQPQADAWLKEAYGYAQRDHALWLSDIHKAGDTGLARYFDTGEGPVPEMADDSTYYQDVITWLLAHPDIHTDYLIDAGEHPDQAGLARLAAISCDPTGSPVCEKAHVGGYWLTADFYKGDRAMRESGFDTTFRWGPFSGSTQHYADVGLNALLFKYEQDLAWMAYRTGNAADAGQWTTMAAARRNAINHYLWNAEKRMYFDYNFTTGRQSSYVYLTTYYPLWAGAADATQQREVVASLQFFERPGGVAQSIYDTGVQWDLPYGWAPTNWIAVEGLLAAGAKDDALRVAREFSATVRNSYQHDHTIHEKYDVTNATSEFKVTAGYTQNVVGFGWTNGVYLDFEKLLAGKEASPAKNN